MTPKLLVACEESQVITKAMREIGIEAYSADIQTPSGGRYEWHIMGDVTPLLAGNTDFVTMDLQRHEVDQWDMLIAHPPCTFLSSAGSCNLLDKNHNIKNPERMKEVIKAVVFFMSFFAANAKKIIIENPAPMHICSLPPYDQIIEPYQFGHPWKKRTCLWHRGTQKLKPTKIVEPKGCWVDATGPNCRTKLRDIKGTRNPKERSKTFPGIAQAMADQYGKQLLEEAKNE